MEFKSTGRYDLMGMKTNVLIWKENLGIQNIDTEDSQGLQLYIRDTYWKFGIFILQSCTFDLIDKKSQKSNLKGK